MEVIQCFRISLLKIPDYLMSVSASIATATDMDPEVFTVGGFEDELVEMHIVAGANIQVLLSPCFKFVIQLPC